MQSEEIVREFFQAYQRHDYRHMYDLLNPGVHFRDMAFDISGLLVFAMWQWLCRKTDDRGPVEVGSFRIIEAGSNLVTAEYRINYDFPILKVFKRKIDYAIPTRFTIGHRQIVEQVDSGSFDVWSRQAFGSLVALVNWSELFHRMVRHTASRKLQRFKESDDFIMPDQFRKP